MIGYNIYIYIYIYFFFIFFFFFFFFFFFLFIKNIKLYFHYVLKFFFFLSKLLELNLNLLFICKVNDKLYLNYYIYSYSCSVQG